MILDPTDRLAQPDGFIGALFAIEGVADATTLLNGPTGCKFPLGETSHDQYRRERAFDMMRWAEEFYFQQDRIPCTILTITTTSSAPPKSSNMSLAGSRRRTPPSSAWSTRRAPP